MYQSKYHKPILLLLTITTFSCYSSMESVTTKDNFESVELPDGSLVYLNHNSSLEYNRTFEERRVKINGEFYFSVVDNESPFLVKSEMGEIKVVGTEFGVKTNSEAIEVEVEEGVVELNTKREKAKLKRGEKAIFNKSDKALRKFKAEFKFKVWMKELEMEFKKLGKELKHASKDIDKESKKPEKKLKKELKKLKNN